jgi:catechol 2,3-dioxygenase-like lactoylglutathione lyase family enzyme
MQRMMLAAFATLSVLGCNAKDKAPSPIAAAAITSTHDTELSPAVPILHVRSLKASQAYYRDVLGFKIDWDYGDPPDFGAVSRGHSVFFLCQGCVSPPGAWMMIFARDVDKLYDELRSRHALIRQPPTNMPWGMREIQVADPDGNVIRFGTGIKE